MSSITEELSVTIEMEKCTGCLNDAERFHAGADKSKIWEDGDSADGLSSLYLQDDDISTESDGAKSGIKSFKSALDFCSFSTVFPTNDDASFSDGDDLDWDSMNDDRSSNRHPSFCDATGWESRSDGLSQDDEATIDGCGINVVDSNPSVQKAYRKRFGFERPSFERDEDGTMRFPKVEFARRAAGVRAWGRNLMDNLDGPDEDVMAEFPSRRRFEFSNASDDEDVFDEAFLADEEN
jgi:hypothetical protein